MPDVSLTRGVNEIVVAAGVRRIVLNVGRMRLVGDRVGEPLTGVDREQVVATLHREGRVRSAEFQLRRRDGTTITVVWLPARASVSAILPCR